MPANGSRPRAISRTCRWDERDGHSPAWAGIAEGKLMRTIVSTAASSSAASTPAAPAARGVRSTLPDVASRECLSSIAPSWRHLIPHQLHSHRLPFTATEMAYSPGNA